MLRKIAAVIFFIALGALLYYGYVSMRRSPVAHAPSGPFKPMTITSPAFIEGRLIPERHTCKGAGASPRLDIAGVPANAKSLVLVVDDPDAPSGTFVHWLLWNVPPDVATIGEGESPAVATQGTNGAGRKGFIAPCPPRGVHRYYFRLYALDAALEIPSGAKFRAVEAAMANHVIRTASLMGLVSAGE